MRRSFAIVIATLTLGTAALADDAAPKTAAKTKRVCTAANNGNPLFPQMKCHTVKLETAAVATPAPAATTAAAPASAPVTQVSMQTTPL